MASPEFDREIKGGEGGSLSVIQAIDACYHEADSAKWDRMQKNRINRDVYLSRQDWAGKMEGQSTEFLPKVPVSVEQMAAFIKKGLIQFGSWFSVAVDNNIRAQITGQQVEALTMSFLNNLWAGNNSTIDISTVLADGVKNGLLESLMIFKVHGGMRTVRKFSAERGNVETADDGTTNRGADTLKMEEDEEWRLRIDGVRPEDYFPDPTGNGLFEIHECERDLHEVLKMAEDGVYDMHAVRQLIDVDFNRPLDRERKDRDRNQNEAPPPQFRKRVVLREFWGTLLHSDGTVAERNIVSTVANSKFLIRPPEPNPFWHQESPFIVGPLIRVPWSVWHKALYDDASSLNLAINELFNLMLDGGLAAVWGTRQVRLDDLDDPGQVAGGIPQGTTLAVKNTLPAGTKVMEQVTEGNVPQDAMAMFQFLNSEFAMAALTNEIKMGQIPKKEVRATEVVEASQSQAVTLDGIVNDLEVTIIDKLLEKSWLTILQNADNFPQEVLMGQVDRRTALLIMRASPAERFSLFAGMCKFKAHGLSSTMARSRDFQKLMALNQAIGSNPLMLQAFMKRFSADRTIDYLFRLLNINPENVEKSQEEKSAQAQQEEAQRASGAADITAGQSGGTPAGGAEVPAEANQMANPLSGLTATG